MTIVATDIAVKPITPAIGAVVEGVDLAGGLDPETVRQLRAAWLDRGVLLFRNQDIGEAQLESFIGCFGTPITEPSSGSYGGPTKPSPPQSGRPRRTQAAARRLHAH